MRDPKQALAELADLEDWIYARRAAGLLGCCKATVRRMVRRDELVGRYIPDLARQSMHRLQVSKRSIRARLQDIVKGIEKA